ncbi:hypothetical protein LTR36_000269 [Oleoguttula mirabilis]|uniref:Uncharacterized protein n=1 Tax=Oleoguttula mirabilis TaxID=1507867 RepID=A0AAV9JYA0_9PEZI|nr:hypothetical protein LTR36_000269 [Oleoguttula mirabilis]
MRWIDYRRIARQERKDSNLLYVPQVNDDTRYDPIRQFVELVAESHLTGAEWRDKYKKLRDTLVARYTRYEQT